MTPDHLALLDLYQDASAELVRIKDGAPEDLHAAIVEALAVAHEDGRPSLTQAEQDVLNERQKQRSKWGDAHDDGHIYGAIRLAAASLACDGTDGHVEHPDGDKGENFDPWRLVRRYGIHGSERDDRRKLVIAATLLLAEVERLDRAAAKSTSTTPPSE